MLAAVEADHVYYGPATLVVGSHWIEVHAQVTYQDTWDDPDTEQPVTYTAGLAHATADVPELDQPVKLQLPGGPEYELTKVTAVRREEHADTLVTWWPPRRPVVYPSGGLGCV